MSKTQVSARVQDEEDSEKTVAEATVEYNFGENLDEAVRLFSPEVVFKRFKAAAIVDLQSVVRRHLTGKEPKTQDQIQALVNEWKPGLAKPRKSKTEKALSLLAGMSPSERAALLAELSEGDDDEGDDEE